MSNLLLLLPLAIILVMLLPPIKANVIVAGFVGGITSMIIGGLSIGEATGLFTEGLTRLFGIAPVILFAATSIVLARVGSMSSTLNIARRALRGKVQWIAPIMVIIQSLGVYAAGSGAANTLVSAPLIYSAIGFNPWVVGGLSVASAGAWACSPSAAETAFISEAMGLSVTEYVTLMRPYAIVLWIFGAVLAYVGVNRALKKGELKIDENLDAEDAADANKDVLGDPSAPDWKRALPFFGLLILLVISPVVNNALNYDLLTTFTIPFIVLITAGLLNKINFNDMALELVEGSRTILGYLFLVGAFLGFINMLTEIGTFEVIAKLPGNLPIGLLGIGGLIIGYLISIPAAAYTTAVLIITVPILKSIGIPNMYLGFLTLIVAQGAMICPAQVNVVATAHGFKKSILEIVGNNVKFSLVAAAIIIAMSQVAVWIM